MTSFGDRILYQGHQSKIRSLGRLEFNGPHMLCKREKCGQKDGQTWGQSHDRAGPRVRHLQDKDPPSRASTPTGGPERGLGELHPPSRPLNLVFEASRTERQHISFQASMCWPFVTEALAS